MVDPGFSCAIDESLCFASHKERYGLHDLVAMERKPSKVGVLVYMLVVRLAYTEFPLPFAFIARTVNAQVTPVDAMHALIAVRAKAAPSKFEIFADSAFNTAESRESILRGGTVNRNIGFTMSGKNNTERLVDLFSYRMKENESRVFYSKTEKLTWLVFKVYSHGKYYVICRTSNCYSLPED